MALAWFSEGGCLLLGQPVEVSKLIVQSILLPFEPCVHIVRDSEVFFFRYSSGGLDPEAFSGW